MRRGSSLVDLGLLVPVFSAICFFIFRLRAESGRRVVLIAVRLASRPGRRLPGSPTAQKPKAQPGDFAMITVGMNYHVVEGKQQDFEEKFRAVISALRAADGHTLSTLWKDVSDSASYLITSEWSDEQAFQAFIHSDAFRAVTNWGKEQILSGRPQHKIYKH